MRAALTSAFMDGKRFCEGTALLGELSARTLDTISSLGERLSAPLVALAVRELGFASDAVVATELIVTDEFHGGAEPLMELTKEKSQGRLRPLLNRGCACRNGIYGCDPQGAIDDPRTRRVGLFGHDSWRGDWTPMK